MRDNSPVETKPRLAPEPQLTVAPSAPDAAEVVPLPEALRQIGRDARRDAAIVRFGGE